MGSCIDLRKYQDSDSIQAIYSKIVSGGRSNYKAVIERKVEPPKCPKCNTLLEGNEKFCSECGHKLSADDLQPKKINN